MPLDLIQFWSTVNLHYIFTLITIIRASPFHISQIQRNKVLEGWLEKRLELKNHLLDNIYHLALSVRKSNQQEKLPSSPIKVVRQCILESEEVRIGPTTSVYTRSRCCLAVFSELQSFLPWWHDLHSKHSVHCVSELPIGCVSLKCRSFFLNYILTHMAETAVLNISRTFLCDASKNLSSILDKGEGSLRNPLSCFRSQN